MANNVNGSKEALALLKKSFESCRTTEVNYKNTSGFFVSTAALDQLDNDVSEFLNSLDTDPEGLSVEGMRLKDEIANLKSSSAVAEAALARSKVEVASLAKSHAALKEKNSALADEARKAQDDLHAQKALLSEQVKLASATNEAAKAAVRKAGKGFDPDKAAAAEKERQEALASLQDLQQELERVNRALSTAHKEKDLAQKQVAASRAALTAAEIKNSELQALRLEAMAELPLRKVEVDINSSALKFLLGDKGLSWVKQAAEKHEAEVREKIYNLLQACKGNKTSRTISGLFDLLQVAFDWVRHQSYKTRLAIQPWVALVEGDIRAGVFKHLRIYREELEKILGQLKVKAKQAKDRAKENFKSARQSYFGWQWFKKEVVDWARVLKHRAKRGLSKAASYVHSVFDGWFKAKPGKTYSEGYQPITLFDYETDVVA